MFLNLFYLREEPQHAHPFRDYNFSDFWNEAHGEPFEKIKESYISDRIINSFRADERRPERLRGFDPEFFPVLRFAFTTGCWRSFIRQNHALPVTALDYYLSKAFQFLYLAITLRYWPDGNCPTSANFDIGWVLSRSLDRVQSAQVVKLRDQELDWWWSVYSDLTNFELPVVLRRFEARMKRRFKAPLPNHGSFRPSATSTHDSPEADCEAQVHGNFAVSYRTARAYLACTERHLSRLVQHGALERVGEGHQRKILSTSLRRYKGAPAPS